MATLHVWHGGSNTSPYDTWAKAATTMATALAAATNADTILAADDHAFTANANITWTFPTSPGLRVISTNRTSGLPSPGATESIGAVNARFQALNSAYVYGVTVNGSTDNSSSCDIRLHVTTANGCVQLWDESALNLNSAFNGMRIFLGETPSTSGDDIAIDFRKCTLKSGGHANNGIEPRQGRFNFDECTFTGTTHTTQWWVKSGYLSQVTCHDCDFSGATAVTTMVSTENVPSACTFQFIKPKLPSSVAMLSSGSGLGKGGPEVWLLDGSSGDTHGLFGYYTQQGSAVSDQSTYLTAGVAGQSWKITTTSAVSRGNPFFLPWVPVYHTGTSAITPYFECLRNDGTATKYTDAEVWAVFSAKATSGSTKGTQYRDRAGLLDAGTAQADGAGTGAWTIGSSNSPASFKCDSGSSFTPAEVGDLVGRLVVAVPSLAGTLHVDPVVRGT